MVGATPRPPFLHEEHEICLLFRHFPRRTHEKLQRVTFRNPKPKPQNKSKCQTAKNTFGILRLGFHLDFEVWNWDLNWVVNN